MAALRAFGLRRNDRVAIVLPNGPDMAVAFLGVASGATCAPLNPAYRASEFDFYLTDLDAKALIIAIGVESPAREVAARRGIPIVELTVEPERASRRLPSGGAGRGAPSHGGRSQTDDMALVLHTSGTTSRPKIVPLSPANLCTSGHNVSLTLALTRIRSLSQRDAALSHSRPDRGVRRLADGWRQRRSARPGSMPNASSSGWMRSSRRGTPRSRRCTRRSSRGWPRIARSSRAARSGSSVPRPRRCPTQVLTNSKRRSGRRVVEAYGMTEAAHQMTSNPLRAARSRKPGSVGVAMGPDVAIMDDEGRLLPQAKLGEIVIRGPNVTTGYENNPTANASAFTNGWFRTGDQGRFDERRLPVSDRPAQGNHQPGRREDRAARKSTRFSRASRPSLRRSPSRSRIQRWAKTSPPPSY